MARYGESHDIVTLEAAQVYADTPDAPRWFGQEIWCKPNGAYVVVASFDCKPLYSLQLLLIEQWIPICYRFNGGEWQP